MLRHDKRTPDQMRPIRFTPNFTKHSAGSVLIEVGDTQVICAVTIEKGVPSFLRNATPPQGWLTAEYSMLPSATNTRMRRERSKVSGRTQEIQRLIGRSLRGAVDLHKCPELSFTVDCDVIQADGGTRTASITGAMVALRIAVNKALADGTLKADPIVEDVAAISVGVQEDQILVDLDYIEDSSADLDMNIVMNSKGKFLEIQGTAEREAFSKEQANVIMDAAAGAIENLIALQNQAAEGNVVEG